MLASLFLSLLLGTVDAQHSRSDAAVIEPRNQIAYQTELLSNKRAYALYGLILSQRTIIAEVTGFNTVSGQTDSSPCVAAGGYICGRSDVVACPRQIDLGTWVLIEGVGRYQCMDRLAQRFDHRFDISFDQDVAAALHFGRQVRTVQVL